MAESGVIVLGIDTSTSHTSVALGTEQGVIAEAGFTSPRKQDHVVPAIEQLLEWAGLTLSNIGGIAVGLGPGLYTGLDQLPSIQDGTVPHEQHLVA